jgi:hypothetical protein
MVRRYFCSGSCRCVSVLSLGTVCSLCSTGQMVWPSPHCMCKQGSTQSLAMSLMAWMCWTRWRRFQLVSHIHAHVDDELVALCASLLHQCLCEKILRLGPPDVRIALCSFIRHLLRMIAEQCKHACRSLRSATEGDQDQQCHHSRQPAG